MLNGTTAVVGTLALACGVMGTMLVQRAPEVTAARVMHEVSGGRQGALPSQPVEAFGFLDVVGNEAELAISGSGRLIRILLPNAQNTELEVTDGSGRLIGVFHPLHLRDNPLDGARYSGGLYLRNFGGSPVRVVLVVQRDRDSVGDAGDALLDGVIGSDRVDVVLSAFDEIGSG